MSSVGETTWEDLLQPAAEAHRAIYSLYVAADELAISHRLPDVLARERMQRQHSYVPEPYRSIRHRISNLENAAFGWSLKYQAQADANSSART